MNKKLWNEKLFEFIDSILNIYYLLYFVVMSLKVVFVSIRLRDKRKIYWFIVLFIV